MPRRLALSRRLGSICIGLTIAVLAAALIGGEARALDRSNASNRVPKARSVLPSSQPAQAQGPADPAPVRRRAKRHRG